MQVSDAKIAGGWQFKEENAFIISHSAHQDNSKYARNARLVLFLI